MNVKVGLGILYWAISLALAGFLGYRLSMEHTKAEGAKKNPEIPFKVVRYADKSTGAIESATGIPAPFSVLVYERRIHKVVPGFIAPVDDVVWLPVPQDTLDKN